MSVEDVDFSEFILKDLISEGYSGEELAKKVLEVKSKIPAAIDKMAEDALKNKPFKFNNSLSLDEFLDDCD